MKVLLTADIHMTLNPKDEYRWGLWEFLREQVRDTGADAVLIAGDLTAEKDEHSAKLVNRLARAVRGLAQDALVYIIPGNHDYIDPKEPFFGFLDESDKTDRVFFFPEPEIRTLSRCRVLFLPCTRQPESWNRKTLASADYIIAHQTFDGAKAENGVLLSGISPDVLAGVTAQVWSGDVHVPQKVGKVNYIGAPYHERFGDNFAPRVVLLDLVTQKVKTISTADVFPSRLKFVGTPEEFGSWLAESVKDGDQAKVTIELSAKDRPDWPGIRDSILESAKEYGLDVCAIALAPSVKERTRGLSKRCVVSFESLVREYAKDNELDVEVGLGFLHG